MQTLFRLLSALFVLVPFLLFYWWALLVAFLLSPTGKRRQLWSDLETGDIRRMVSFRVVDARCGCKHIEFQVIKEPGVRHTGRFHFGRCLDRV